MRIVKDGKKRLKEELAKYTKRLRKLEKLWAATRGGSCYGDEYVEGQIKVYGKMIKDVKAELAGKKGRKR